MLVLELLSVVCNGDSCKVGTGHRLNAVHVCSHYSWQTPRWMYFPAYFSPLLFCLTHADLQLRKPPLFKCKQRLRSRPEAGDTGRFHISVDSDHSEHDHSIEHKSEKRSLPHAVKEELNTLLTTNNPRMKPMVASVNVCDPSLFVRCMLCACTRSKIFLSRTCSHTYTYVRRTTCTIPADKRIILPTRHLLPAVNEGPTVRGNP